VPALSQDDRTEEGTSQLQPGISMLGSYLPGGALAQVQAGIVRGSGAGPQRQGWHTPSEREENTERGRRVLGRGQSVLSADRPAEGLAEGDGKDGDPRIR
jgi:hypothetical protein